MLFWEVPYYSYSIMGPKNLILIIKAPMLGLRVQGGRRRVGVVVEGVLGDHEPETLCSMLVANKVSGVQSSGNYVERQSLPDYTIGSAILGTSIHFTMTTINVHIFPVATKNRNTPQDCTSW